MSASKKSADQWFLEYGESHQDATNKLIHWICVPSIVASIIGLIWSIPVPAAMASVPLLNWATVLLLLSLIFYVRLSVPLAIGMIGFALAVVGLIWSYEEYVQPSLGLTVWQLSLTVFVAAWIGQFVGHRIEGKKPSFFQDLQFLMIGPIWLLGFVYRKLGIRY